MSIKNVENVNITNAIVHILDNKNDKVILNDFEVHLNKDTSELLVTHIVKSINDESRRLALFNGTENVIKNLSQKALDDKSKFINISKEIAQNLYRAMKRNPNISPANFIVCICKENDAFFISLLKMDFDEIFQTKIEEIEGQTKISIVNTGNGIPNKKQKLQKCAFIDILEDNEEYDIILLDKQASKSNKDSSVSKFFAEGFLNCKLAKTDTDNTKEFKKQASKFIYKYINDDPIKSNELQTLFITSLKTGGEININTLAKNAFGYDESIKNKFIDEMKDKIGDMTFNVDEAWVEQNLKAQTIITDTGYKIIKPIKMLDNKDTFEIQKRKDGSGKVDIIIKNVSKYKEK